MYNNNEKEIIFLYELKNERKNHSFYPDTVRVLKNAKTA
jgi:hypothetical protein